MGGSTQLGSPPAIVAAGLVFAPRARVIVQWPSSAEIVGCPRTIDIGSQLSGCSGAPLLDTGPGLHVPATLHAARGGLFATSSLHGNVLLLPMKAAHEPDRIKPTPTQTRLVAGGIERSWLLEVQTSTEQ